MPGQGYDLLPYSLFSNKNSLGDACQTVSTKHILETNGVSKLTQRTLEIGEPAPWFVCRSPANPRYSISSVAGRYVVLCFFGSASDQASRRVLDDVLASRHVFDDENVCFFGVSADPEDETMGRVENALPGIRFFWDFDLEISRAFGAVPDSVRTSLVSYKRISVVLDERLRVLAVFPFGQSADGHVSKLNDYLKTLPDLKAGLPAAPVLTVPRVFTTDLCQQLIDYYESHGGDESGFMREEQGITVYRTDYGFKRRRDQQIRDQSLRTLAMHRIHDCLVPEIKKAFQFHATRIERYLVACYDSTTADHFRPHRDDTSKGTAHRKFAVSINLNSEFEGGDLRFPEFGCHTYKAPIGGAVVFSCSLLHEATPITKGKRYAFLPFLYDDAAARIRQKNKIYIDPSAR